MQNPVFRYGLICVLVCFAILNFYKTKNFYSDPDFPYDGRNVHLGGKLWLKGENPYNDSLLNAEWINSVKTNRTLTKKPPGFPDSGFIYPFWSIPVLIPYYIVSWPFARQLIWILSFIFLFVLAWFSYKSFKYTGLSFAFVLLIILAFKSSFVALVLGQPFLFSLAALMVSWYFYLKNKETLSGLILGIALVKITLCIPFVIFFLINKKWKLLFFSGILPLMGAISFYAISGDFYINEMLLNVSYKMQLNYSGHTINAMNTNLTEIGILFNYFFDIGYKTISVFNIVMLAIGTLCIAWLYLKERIKNYHFLALLIIWNMLFTYHQIYDCLILIFLVPLVKTTGNSRWIWLILLSPLFLPINGIFKNMDWIQFHLPVTLLILFLYLVYECYRNHTTRIV